MSTLAEKSTQIDELVELGCAPDVVEDDSDTGSPTDETGPVPRLPQARPRPMPRPAPSPGEQDGSDTSTPSRPGPARKPVARPTTRNSKLARFLPDGERVKLWKRSLGQRRYVRHYTMADLSHAQDIETFLQTYVVPAYGEGEYDVEVVAGDGQVTRTLTLSVLDPNAKPPVPVGGPPPEMGQLVERLLSRIESLEREARQPPKTFAEQIEEVTRVQQMLGGEDRSDVGTIAAVLMATQQNQQAPALASEVAAIKAELRELAKSQASPPVPQLPLPPPPADEPKTDWAAVMRELVAASKGPYDLKDLAAALKPAPSTSTAELLQVVVKLAPMLQGVLAGRSAEVEQLRAQQLDMMREELRQLRTAPARGIREVLEEMAAVAQFMGTGKRSSVQASESFWGFMSKVVDQFPQAMQSLSGLTESIRTEQQAPVRARVSAPRKPVPEPRPASLVDRLGPLVQAIEDAGDEASRIEATLKAFYVLGQAEPWRVPFTKALEVARAGDKDEALRWLTAFLDGLVDAKHLSQAARDSTVEAFKAHLDKVIMTLKGIR